MRYYAAFNILLTASILAALQSISRSDDRSTRSQPPTGNASLEVAVSQRSDDPIAKLVQRLSSDRLWENSAFPIVNLPASASSDLDAIDRLTDTLRATRGLWRNGKTQPIRLPASATPEEIVAEAVRKSFPPETLTTLHLVKHRDITIDLFEQPVSKVSAALVEMNKETKVLLFYFLGDTLGWWNRFYEASAAPATMQASVAEVAALDRVVKKLTEETTRGINGRQDTVPLPADASSEAVLDAAIRVDAPIRAINPPYGAITSHQIKLVRKITPKSLTEGPFPTNSPWYAALVATNLGTKILVFQHTGKEWFTRFYDSDALAPTASSHASLQAYPNAILTLKDARTQHFFYVESNGRRLVAFSKDAAILWSVDVLEATHVTPRDGAPVIRFLSMDAEVNDRILVVFGKHDYAEVEASTGKTKYLGSN